MAHRQSTLEGLVVSPRLHTGPVLPGPAFWSGKRVLLTGHTGFKGAWLAFWLHRLGAEVLGVSLPPNTNPSLFSLANIAPLLSRSIYADIGEVEKMAAETAAFEPEIVFHLAAQALVRASYRDPIGTFATNVVGTASVLDAVRRCQATRVAVVITTDKVYRNLEQPYPYRESDSLGGHDPYSASKAAAEIVIACYRDAYLAERGVAVASARAGNVIGGGDWSNDRLIPDAVRAWVQGEPLHLRRPSAVRPWQHVLEPLSGYLKLAELLWSEPRLADAYNFGPPSDEAASVEHVVTLARSSFGRGEIVCHREPEGPHEAGLLTLETAKTRAVLGHRPCWPLSTAVERTMEWYRAVDKGGDARAACADDIAAFEALTEALAA
jgi:CDP-glucose 4,6-dehydratase